MGTYQYVYSIETCEDYDVIIIIYSVRRPAVQWKISNISYRRFRVASSVNYLVLCYYYSDVWSPLLYHFRLKGSPLN